MALASSGRRIHKAGEYYLAGNITLSRWGQATMKLNTDYGPLTMNSCLLNFNKNSLAIQERCHAEPQEHDADGEQH